MDYSKFSDDEINQLVLEKMAKENMLEGMKTAKPAEPDYSSMSDEEIDNLVFEKMAQNPERSIGQEKEPQVNDGAEADLGFINRAKYSIEPLESNRRALLIKEFGPENVSQDKEGNLYIKQQGEFRPVNKEGLSVADLTDMAGATPEMAGASAGLLLGMGPASIPFAAAGGAAGSALRQAISAAIGNPQVAKPSERVAEVALSSGLSAAGTGAGKLIKLGAKKSVPLFKRAFSNFRISNEGKMLAKIAKRYNIPEPTSGQLSGGYDLVNEKILTERPFWGKKLRKNLDNQVSAIKKNLSDEFGDFVNEETGKDLAGEKVKNFAKESILAIKKKSSDLFEKVTKEGKEIFVDGGQFYRELNENFTKLGLFDINGNPLAHTSRTGLTQDQFRRVQGIFGSILNDVKKSVSAHGSDEIIQGASSIGQLDVATINTMRKFIDANIKEGSKQGLDDVLLVQLRESFMDVAEGMLGNKSKTLKEEFKLARALWGKQLKLSRIFKKGGQNGLGIEDLSDELVLEKIFKNKKNVKMLKELTDEKTAREAGIGFINDLLIKRLGGEDQISAIGAMNIIRKNSAVKEAIGEKSYKKLMDNLFFLEKIGRPINPSKTGIVGLMKDIGSPTAFASGAAQSAVKKARENTLGASVKLLKGTNKLPKISGKAANLLTDEMQREGSYLTRGPKKFSENKKEENGRKPALKGRKKWINDGALILKNDVSENEINLLNGSKKGQDLLIKASTVKSKEAKRKILERIKNHLKDK